jgi:hypothetical protein
MRSLPATLQTTYANLLQMHLNRPAFDFEGAPFTMIRKGKTYWYANQRPVAGGPPRQRYLGPDTEEMRQRIEQMRSRQQSLADFRKHASALVAQLRAGGIAGPGREAGPVLRVLANSGVFRLGGTLVGTHAFQHYSLELGVYLSEEADAFSRTDDIDIASFEHLSMAIEDKADPDIAQALAQLGFQPANSLTPKTPTSWTLANSSYAIDFLTPSFEESQRPAKLAALNMWAQSLHYLNFLIADPIPAVTPYMEGLLIQVPRPERYAVHKLIVSQKRRAGSVAKKQKDIEQARTLIAALVETRPHELNEALADADSRGKAWREALDRALDLQIMPDKPIRPGDSAEFFGKGLGGPVRLRISGSALTQLYGDDTLETAQKHRPAIEKMFRRQFRTQPSPDILLSSYDLPTAS